MRLNISRPAQTDILEIWLYLAQNTDGTEIADQVIEAIRAKLQALRKTPHMGRNRSNDVGDGIRSLVIGNYIAYYRISNKSIELLRVIHGKRNTPGIQS